MSIGNGCHFLFISSLFPLLVVAQTPNPPRLFKDIPYQQQSSTPSSIAIDTEPVRSSPTIKTTLTTPTKSRLKSPTKAKKKKPQKRLASIKEDVRKKTDNWIRSEKELHQQWFLNQQQRWQLKVPAE